MKSTLAVIVAGMLAVGLARPASAITFGQVDDFQDGTLMNWGGGASPTNISTGGPAGAGDRYLQLTAFGGDGAGSRLATFNSSQWSGNYDAENVSAIEVDLRNPNAEPLHMRIVLFGALGDQWTSATPAIIPADSQWHTALFSLLESDLLHVAGFSPYSSTYTSVTQLMLRHDDLGASFGTPIAGTLGIDNIKATVIPEPATGLVLGGVALMVWRRRR